VATAEQIRALLQSHIEGDEDRFLTIAMQVAAHEARQGHGKIAHELRALIDEATERTKAPRATDSPVPVVQPRGELAGLLQVLYPKVRLSDMVFDDATRARLERVVLEQRQASKLSAHGLGPRRKLLLVGPPGTGKTLTAGALAGELNLPLFSVLLDGLLSKFLGESAAKLRLVFEALPRVRGVYLFDEFDALGGRRAASNDVGEMRRVLNSFLQFLEQDASQSLIVAATNHAELLDRALFRRFDDVITYALPGDELVEAAFRNRLSAFDTGRVDWPRVVIASRGLSYADIAKAAVDAAKTAVLRDETVLATGALLASVDERRGEPPNAKVASVKRHSRR
jgi:SpoVK/Ycf46/Vps4 family AAA+-type ATPase